MYLTLTSLEWLIWNEDVKQLTIDTMSGQITILPWHDNLISVLKPWLIKIVPTESTTTRRFDFLIDKEYIVFGVLWWVLTIEDNQIQILTNMVITDQIQPLDVLTQAKQSLIEKQRTIIQWTWIWSWMGDDTMIDLQAQIDHIDLEMKLGRYKQMKK